MSEELENKIEQAENQPAEEITQQSENQPVEESIQQSENQPAEESIQQSENQPAEQTTNQSDNQTEENKTPNLKWQKPAIAAGILALVAAGAVYAYSQTPGQKLASSLSLGNRYLNEVNYEQAVAEFSKALEIEPRNEEALKGILEAAARTDDQELFQATFQSLLEVYQSDETITEEEWETLTQMALAAEQHYSETAYLELLQEMISDTEDPALKERYLVILNEAADEEWKQRNFEAVLDNLEKAYQMDPENEQIREELIHIVKEYAEYCRQNQQYDKGMERIEWVRDLLGDPELLKEQETSLLAMQDADGRIQEIVNQLNACFESDDITGIMDLMSTEEWQEQTDKVYRVFYSQNLLEQAGLNGKGTGIYKSYGTIYVYYGNYENGIRQGEGLWYAYNDTYNVLDKYSLNWVNGVPQGAVTADIYTAARTVGWGGVLIREHRTHRQQSFSVVNGILNGAYAENGTYDDGTQYVLNADFVNGIGKIVETPSDIKPYLQENERLIAVGETSTGGNIWLWYSTSPWYVPGIYSPYDYTATSITLE